MDFKKAANVVREYATAHGMDVSSALADIQTKSADLSDKERLAWSIIDRLVTGSGNSVADIFETIPE